METSAQCSSLPLDVLSHIFGYNEPWTLITDNTLVEGAVDVRPLERLLDHLSYWYLNDVEYNLPLKQADTLARFDRNLYVTKYEPSIIKRLKQAGLDIKGTRRNLREMNT